MKGLTLRLLVIWLAVFAIVATQSGCAGMGVKAEAYRIDQRQESQRTWAKNNGLKCLFWHCPEVETTTQVQGS